MQVKTTPLASTFLLSLSFLSPLAQAADRDVQVLRYETAALDFKSSQAASVQANGQPTAITATTLRFTAFGKNYTVNLVPNTRVTPAATRARPYLGTIDGLENSWARITRSGDQVHGLIFDGTDLLAIEPAAAISSDARDATATAVFRLADTKTNLGADFCTVDESPPQNALDMIAGLNSGLGADSKRILAQAQSSAATKRLEMSALMDAAFRARYASDADANDAIVARINNVDGIFASQLGIEVTVTQVMQADTAAQPIFVGTNPDSLLQSLSRMRSSSANLYGTGITHLFTGIDMDGSTVGIAYINAVCTQQYSVSLGEARDRGVWFDSLVVAHEIGHTFGAPHDGSGQCSTTPSTFLMAPTINGSNQFSQCSLGIIQAKIQTASCLVPIPVADISLPTDLGSYHAAQNQSFTWSFAVSNVGNADSQTSRVQLIVPAALTVSSANVDGGSCSVGGGSIVCDLGTLSAHSTRNVTLTLVGAQSGTYSIVASVNANSNLDSANDSSTATIRIDPSVDLSIALTGPDSTMTDQSFNAGIIVTNKSSIGASNVTVDIVLPSGVSASGTPSLNGASCQAQFQTIHCVASSIGANQTMTGSITLLAHDPGTQTISAALDGSYVDPQPQDNVAQKSILVGSPPVSAPASSQSTDGKSGGGAFGIAWLVALGTFACRRRIGGMARMESL